MLMEILKRWWREFWEGFGEGKEAGLNVVRGGETWREKLWKIIKMMKDEVS